MQARHWIGVALGAALFSLAILTAPAKAECEDYSMVLRYMFNQQLSGVGAVAELEDERARDFVTAVNHEQPQAIEADRVVMVVATGPMQTPRGVMPPGGAIVAFFNDDCGETLLMIPPAQMRSIMEMAEGSAV